MAETKRMDPIVYGIPCSPPFRSVIITAKAIGLELQVKPVDIYEKNDHKEEWFSKMNPNHTVPTLDDNDFYLWESRAIMAYLVDKYGKNDSLYPKDVQKRAVVDQWMQFDLCWLYQAIVDYLFGPTFCNTALLPAKLVLLNEKLSIVNKVLESRSYVASDTLTLADFCILQSVASCDAFDFDLKPYPALQKWYKTLQTELPFYDDCMKEGVDGLRKYLKELKKK